MSADNQTVREIMIPLSGFPRMKEGGTVQEAIQQLRSFCALNSTGPCGFSELMVVDDAGKLIGRVTQQGILKALFSSLLNTADIKAFEGRTKAYTDLTTLLNGVLIKEGVNHLNAAISQVIERNIKAIPATMDLVQAMSIMVMGGETVLPVEENGLLTGVVKLSEVFAALGDKLISLNSK